MHFPEVREYMKINDLNEKFEEFEKGNISNVFQGLMKITCIVVLAVFLVEWYICNIIFPL